MRANPTRTGAHPTSTRADLTMGRTPLVLDQFSWTLFARLPAELQLEILERCHSHDLVCLSLVSRFFRWITLPLLPAKPKLLDCRWKHKTCNWIGLHITGRGTARYQQFVVRGPTAPQRRNTLSPDNREVHPRMVCNPADGDAWCVNCLSTGYPLFARLQGWMGSRKFCITCRKFTKRPWAKRFGRRCQHGQERKRLRGTCGWSKPSRNKPEKYEPEKHDSRSSRQRAREDCYLPKPPTNKPERYELRSLKRRAQAV
ncbi:hypothetical protein RB601_008086 [Gaeumannomyces tritici]